jgi:cellulose synthase/poly-beta-1,6-N-acetylglucosamine synthase-like glycosyltransferase
MDVHIIPRINSSNILDFESSYVNSIYNAQSNPVIGYLAVVGYFIVTIFDIIWLVKYTSALFAIIFPTIILFQSRPPWLVAIIEAIRRLDLDLFTDYLAGEGLSPTNTPEKKAAEKSTFEDSTTKKAPQTVSDPSAGQTLPNGNSTKKAPETVFAPPTDQTLPHGNSIENFPEQPFFSPRTGKTRPKRNLTKKSPTVKDSANISSPKRAPSGATRSEKNSKASGNNLETQGWLCNDLAKITKLLRVLLGVTWNNFYWVIGFIAIVTFGVLAVFSFKSFQYSLENVGQANSGQATSPRTHSLDNVAKRILAGFLQYVAYPALFRFAFVGPVATWTNAIIFLSLASVVTAVKRLRHASVALVTFLNVIAILVSYQTLWTVYTLALFIYLGCVAVIGPINYFSAVSFLGFVYGTNIICFSSTAITAISLVSVAILAWATHLLIAFMKRRYPTVVGLPFAILTWQPIFWTTIFWIGRYHDSFTYSLLGLMELYWHENVFLFVFLLLATFKGTKIIIHTISYYLYTRPVAPPRHPTITPADVTVIIPTCGTFGDDFGDCLRSILDNEPEHVIVSTCGHAKHIEAIRVCEGIDRRVQVISIPEPCKRTQLIEAVENVKTPITIYADDHVVWPNTFLRSALAPFEDPIVGLVGTSKRVIRNRNQGAIGNFLNYIACIYLERHNFECTATYNIDGGVFVISGRTALARTSILHSVEYREDYQNEHFLGVGPMKVDDDNFNTRFMVRHGFKTVFHNDPLATITTTLVTTPKCIPKFRCQLMRWARTTWRSNLKSLIMDRTCYQRTPWTTYAMFVSSLVNFAIIYDILMAYTLYKSRTNQLCAFFVILLLSKIIKPLPHLMREYSDWKFVPFGILFGYFHSFIKFWAMLTMFNVEWSGRSGIKAMHHSSTASA